MPTPDPIIPDIANTPEVATELLSGPSRPLVLLPVGLETRFFETDDGNVELRVRVYPDKVHIDSHEPGLTADELTWGRHFWEQTWRADDDEERARVAWQQLADRFDPSRAAWIARVLKPGNPGDRPASPIAPDQPLPTPVQFPSPATKDEAWTRAPRTRVLPSRWFLLGYKNGRLVINVQGAAIPDVLATGPDPSPSATVDEAGVDDGMRWIVDFDEAETRGMGIRATLAPGIAAAGLDFLLVLGVKDAPGGTTGGTPLLAELLDAHHYTDGLSFVPQGMPTNNTEETPSGFRSRDPGQEASYAAERSAPAVAPGDGSNADVLSAALGLAEAAPALANIPEATAKEQLDARHMNRALWPATWGYFLSQMMSGNQPSLPPLTDEDISWVRQHFIDHVRAAGPLPALRVGRQPYGLLPVTSLNAWKPKAGQEPQQVRDTALKDFLVKLRDVWRENLAQVPRIGGTDQSGRDFADVLSMDGISSGYAMRHLLGELYLRRGLWPFLVPGDLAQQDWLVQQKYWWLQQQTQTRAGLARVGLDWDPRLSHATYSGWYAPLRGPVTQPEPLTEDGPLAPNYIDMLLTEPDFEKIRGDNWGEPRPRGLLYLVLRHAMLLEYRAAALNLLYPRPSDRQSLGYWLEIQEKELIGTPGFGTLARFPPAWELFDRSAAGVTGRVGDFLHTLRAPPGPDLAPQVAALLEFRDSLAHLRTLGAATLQRLFAGTLDLCSHRLDAWITSLATKRLAEIRQADPDGVLIGGYGWVMNLHQAAPQTPVSPIPGEPGPIVQSADNPGFVHTPSLTQAATAALLRSGHLSHAGNGNPDDLFAIDLSSERARLATWLLDGVRQGQPLGSLLGYRFERRLQEAGKPQFTSYLRELAPLVAKKLEATDEPVEAIAANNVVDGLELQRRWQAALEQLRSLGPPPGGGGALTYLFAPLEEAPAPADLLDTQTVLEAELNALADSVDAVSDALMAETVHQIVRGNPLRAASTVESIAGGDAPPPELEVVQTPRTGVALTHRVVALFGATPVLPPGWGQPAQPFRANAEPYLNAWAARLLGDPSMVRCLVDRLDPETREVLESKEIRLDQLRLGPLDFIYAIDGGQGGQAEIEQRILYLIMRQPDGFPPGTPLQINPGRKPEWLADELGYGEYAELLRAARNLLTGVRGIDAADLTPPDRSVEPSADVRELEGRADAAEQALGQIAIDLQTQLAAGTTVDLDLLRDSMLDAGGFGVAGAVPLSTAGELPADRATLLTQAGSIQHEVAQRVDRLTELNTGFHGDTATAQERRDQATARLRTAFGQAFVVLPRFTVPNAAELGQALAGSEQLQAGDRSASTTWFQRTARVRDGVGRLNQALGYAEALGTGERLQLIIAQLPYAADDRWVGLPLEDGQTLPGGKLSLAVQSTTPIDVQQPLAGVLVDEWLEVVPNTTEITGIALQYDQPNSAPPQSILIATPPDLDAPWTLWSLQQVLLETLDLARIRGVDSDALDEVGHYLPALYFAVNTANDTISTDFRTVR